MQCTFAFSLVATLQQPAEKLPHASFVGPHLPSYGSVDATTSLHPTQVRQQQPELVGTQKAASSKEADEEESLRVASFQAQHQEEKDPPQRTAVSSSSLQDLGGTPALFQDAERSSSFGLGRTPALEEMYSDKSSASISASSLEEHMSSRHRFSQQLAPVITQLSSAVNCLQDCIRTLVELQSDSFDQQDATAELGQEQRESSLRSLNSSRDKSNNNKTRKEKRSSLGELTPRTCKSKSDETGSHPELKPEELEQREANQGPKQQPLAYESTREHYSQQKLPKNQRCCMICWKRGHTTEACWYNDQWQNQQHQTAWTTPSTVQQQTARASEKELQHRPYNYSLTLGDQPMGSLQQLAQASTQQLAYKSPEQSTKNSLGEQSQQSLGAPYKNSLGEQPKNNKSNWAILIDTGAERSVAPRSSRHSTQSFRASSGA